MTEVVAIDLGATSGRVALGHVSADTLDVRVVSRFPNRPVRTPDGLHWDVLELYRNITEGLRQAAAASPDAASFGIDGWAVDYGLLRDGRLLGMPYHYRDERTRRGVTLVDARVPPAELFRRTGIQRLPIDTVYQLAAETDLLRVADTILLLPDLMSFWLTGTVQAERTNASTTALVGIADGDWDAGLLRRLGIDRALFPQIVEPGSGAGALRPELAEDHGLPGWRHIVVASHDTASAVVATPMDAERAAFISCGTWSLAGVELPAPVLTEAARSENFTNEAGLDGRIRFLKNVMGLWVLTEALRTFERQGEDADLTRLLRAAADVTEPIAVFDVDDPRFMPPGDMPARIREWCAEHAVAAPRGRAGYVRSIVESLAHALAAAVRDASSLSGVPVETIHMVGGGARNELLCQRLADLSGWPVVAGPAEATVIGNVLVQARALSASTESLEAVRSRVRDSMPVRRYEPMRRSPSGQLSVVESSE